MVYNKTWPDEGFYKSDEYVAYVVLIPSEVDEGAYERDEHDEPCRAVTIDDFC